MTFRRPAGFLQHLAISDADTKEVLITQQPELQDQVIPSTFPNRWTGPRLLHRRVPDHLSDGHSTRGKLSFSVGDHQVDAGGGTRRRRSHLGVGRRRRPVGRHPRRGRRGGRHQPKGSLITMKLNRTATAVAGSAAIALVLAGCSTDDSTDATASSAATSTAADGTEASRRRMTFEKAYIKPARQGHDRTSAC